MVWYLVRLLDCLDEERKEEKMDTQLLYFVQDNIITISLVLGVLKVIAIETPWAGDDKIVEIITGLLRKKD